LQKRLVRRQPALILEQPAFSRLEQAIKCTLTDSALKGNSEQHLKRKGKYLLALSKHTDLFDPKATTLYILNAKSQFEPNEPLCNGYKKEIIEYYADFCKSNQIPFDKPRLIYEPPIPIIRTTEQVHEIINSCHARYACIFTILAETGAEQIELHRTPITRINKEKGEISINGVKQHANGVYKLKEQTANMLRTYLSQHPNEEYPFPLPKYMRQAWITARKHASVSLCKPELNTIPLKNLRNYAGAQVWLHGYNAGFPPKDAIAVMRFMRHKRLEQTLHYIRSINLDEPMEYVTVAIQLGQPDTQKRIIEHANAGYEKLTDADGYLYMRIRK
jgi:integrase